MPAEVTPNTEVAKPDAAIAPAAGEVATKDAPAVAGAEAPKDAPKGDAAKQGEDAAPKTALEAAKQVMAKEGKQTSDEPPQTKTAEPPKTVEAPKGEDDDAALPFRDHPRWKTITSENRILKVAKEKNEEAIKELGARAKVADDLSVYLRENNLGREEFQSALTIMSAVRNDPAKAYELLRPTMERLEALVGERLPADLQKQVEEGLVTEAVAKELAKTRGAAAMERARAETAEARAAREREEREQGDYETVVNDVVNTLNECERSWAASDPDAVKLRPFLNDAVMVNGQKNPPRSAAEARALFDASLAEVKKRMAGFIPPPKPKDDTLPPGGASTQSASPVPKSSLEAARAALTMR